MDNLPEAWEKYVEAAAQAVFDGFVGGTNDPTLLDLSASIADGHARAAILAFLNEAEKDGRVMVPRDAGETMLEAGRKAWKAKRLHVSHAASDEFMTCGMIYRAMVNAAKEEGNTPDSPPSTPVV